MYVYIYIYIYICVYIYIYISLSLSLYIYIYIYIYEASLRLPGVPEGGLLADALRADVGRHREDHDLGGFLV